MPLPQKQALGSDPLILRHTSLPVTVHHAIGLLRNASPLIDTNN